jgi:magnesium transporter
MNQTQTKRSVKAGLPPGTPVHIGETPDATRIGIVRYTSNTITETEVASPDECKPSGVEGGVTWVTVTGLADVGAIEHIGVACQLHPLIVEDMVNTSQRPKIEEYGDYLYVVLKVFSGGNGKALKAEQVSLVIGRDYLISIEEHESALFRPVRERLHNGKGRIRNLGADFLAYSLIDSITDSYFAVIEQFGEVIEGVEDRLVTSPKPDVVQAIHRLRRQILLCRHVLWPTREVITTLERSAPAGLIADATTTYFRDVYDHLIQLLDTVEIYRDTISGLLDIYLSSMSNRLNQIMKVLTLIATIFMPLTFIAGVYGMNFRYMPELEWRYGYLAIVLFMAAVVLVMLIFFKKRKWF